MSKGINKAIILGNLGKDPETRYAPSGAAITSFSIATSETWNDKQSGEKKEKTEWHNITAFGKLAEICGQYLKKGSKVYIEGKITTDKWQDKDGNDRYTTKIIANQMQMLDSKSDFQRGQEDGRAAPQQSNQGFDDFPDDKIPF